MIGEARHVIECYMAEVAKEPAAGAWIDLTRAHRRGSGAAEFLRARYFGTSPGSLPYSDGPINFSLRVASETASGDARIAVHIYDRFGTRLIDVNTMFLGTPIPMRPGEFDLSLSIESLHLAPGVYRVTLGMGGANEHYDEVTDAFSIKVRPSPACAEDVESQRGVVSREFRYQVDWVR
jgi:hypothetical protein